MSFTTTITDNYILIYLLLKMDQTLGGPYLTAVLRASVPELDLSGSRPFGLELVVTLYVSRSYRASGTVLLSTVQPWCQ
jgi:hypothetical protein